MNNEDRIIGSAVFDILRSSPEEEISKNLLIQNLTRKYVQLYDTSASVDESLLYESALKIVMSSPA